MARAAWPWTLVLMAASALVAASLATAALILLVRVLSRLRRSQPERAAPGFVRLSSNGFGADQEPSRPLDGNEEG